MKLCALEVPASFGEPSERLADVRAALAEETADLFLLPECALTGYVSPELDFDLRPFAEPLDGPTTRAYRALARERGSYLAGPLVEQQGASFFNSFVVVAPGGELIAHYRKRHPWIPETWAERGREPHPMLEIAGLRLTLAICYDVHFLPREAHAALAAADVLLFPSAWVDDGATDLRTEIFRDLVRRFGLSVVNANWGEGRPRLPGQGRSRIVGPAGAVEAPRRPGAITSVVAQVAPKSQG